MTIRKSKILLIELTGEQVDGLRDLAGGWDETLDEALRRRLIPLT